MAEEPEFVPVAVCELCWLIANTEWEPESMDANGQIVMRMTGVVMPTKVDTESVDVCSECGGLTVAGIYVLRDASEVENLDLEYGDDYDDVDNDPTRFIFSMVERNDEEDDYEG